MDICDKDIILVVLGRFSRPTPLDYSGENAKRAVTPTRDHEENREIGSRNSFNSRDHNICSDYDCLMYLEICNHAFEAQFCLSTLYDIALAWHSFLLGSHFQ